MFWAPLCPSSGANVDCLIGGLGAAVTQWLADQQHGFVNLMFVGPRIVVITENKNQLDATCFHFFRFLSVQYLNYISVFQLIALN